MSIVVRTPPAPEADAPAQPPGSRARAMLALARAEARRSARHPVTIAAVLLFTGPWLYSWLLGDANRYPVLHDEDRAMQFPCALVLGGAALVVANLAVLRPRRHGTNAVLDVLLLPPAWRTGAHLLAVLPLGLIAATAVGVRITVLAAAPGAAGRVNAYELATGPIAVVLLGAVGVVAARLVDSFVVALLGMILLGVLTVGLSLPGTPGHPWLRWFLPVAVQDDPLPLPADLLARPAAAHLVYLLGVVVLLSAVALACTGARGRRLLAVAAAGLVTTLGAGTAQALPVDDAVVAARTAASQNPADQQVCRRLDGVTYCAFPDFLPWVEEWDTVVRGVLHRVPGAQTRRPLAVRQRIAMEEWLADMSVSAEEMDARAAQWRSADRAAGTPNAITVSTQWGDPRSEIAFAGLVAYELITREGAGAHGTVCGARGVLLAWLAGQATAQAGVGLREVDATSQGGVPFGDLTLGSFLSVSDREMAVATRLLERPADDVAAVVLRSWEELTSKDTPTERAGAIFGVPVEAPLPPAERATCTA